MTRSLGIAVVAWLGLHAGVGRSPAARPRPDLPPATRELLPVPASVAWRDTRLAVDSNFTVAMPAFADQRLRHAVDRALTRLAGRAGFRVAGVSGDTVAATLLVRVQGPGMAVQGPEEDESYTIEVDASRATLAAPTVVGAIRGLETLLQLVATDSAGYFLPGVSIADGPRFPWRGLLIDVSRHFEPVAVIERNLDAMAAVKLNVLHWHLTDDQGFRVQSLRYPRLQDDGSDGHYYTQDEIREVVAYARERGIRVVPEFDVPAHSTSWFVGYPGFASAPGPYHIEREFGVHDAVFDPTRDSTYEFLDGFYGEMAALFPDAYLHIGGDETNGVQWDASPAIQAFKQAHGLADDAALQAYFNQRLEKIVQAHGKKMVGWDEILAPGLPQDVVIQSWRGPASLAQAAKQGYRGILSSGYYLDAMATAADHYAVDPLPDSAGLSGDDAARVLGGEVCMWGEIVTPETIDSRIWPRAAAIAERFWSPASVRDAGDMYRRLDVESDRLAALGVNVFHTARMLKRLAPGLDVRPIAGLLGVLSPVSLGGRMHVDPANQLTPLTALSDAARPDPEEARRVSALADSAVGGARAARDSLAAAFRGWRGNLPLVQAVARRAPPVREAVILAQELADLGGAGLEALTYLARGKRAPAAWRAREEALLQRAAAPHAHLRFAMLPALTRLLDAAAGPKPGGR